MTLGGKITDRGTVVSGFELPPATQHEAVTTNEAKHAHATAALSLAQDERDREDAFLGRVIDIDATATDSFSKIA